MLYYSLKPCIITGCSVEPVSIPGVERVLSIAASDNNSVWVGTDIGAYLVHAQGVEPRGVELGETSGLKIRSVDIAPDDTVWFGTDDGELFRLLHDWNWQVFSPLGGLPEASIRSLYVDVKGGIWIGTSNGLFQMQPDAVLESAKNDVASSNIESHSSNSIDVVDYVAPWKEGQTLIYTGTVSLNPNEPNQARFEASTRLDGSEVVNGKTYQRVVGHSIGVPPVTYLRVADQGIYRLDNSHPEKPEYLMLPRYLDIGQTWTASKHGRSDTNILLEGNGAVETKMQRFEDCIRMKNTTQDAATVTYETVYYCKNVGLVKSERTQDNVTMTLTLSRIQTTVQK